MQIASRQGKSLPEARKSNSSSDFVLWKVFFDWEVNSFHREDHFLAAIAAEICRLPGKRRKVQDSRFLIKFKTGTPKPIQDPQARIKASKAFWGGLAGLKE